MRKINKHKNGKNKQPEVQRIDLKCHTIQQLYERAASSYQQHDSSNKDAWNMRMAQSGTKQDKITAVATLLMENPENSLRYFDALVKWTSDNNHNFALKASEALAVIYIDHIFGQKPTLKMFVESIQAQIKKKKKKSQIEDVELIGFYLQHEIKQYYKQFINRIQALLDSTLIHVKKGCLRILGKLARFKELRRMILSTIINKLGDHDMDIVNEASKCLKTQFYEDLIASQTLLEETERFLFRQNLPKKSQFYVINFLNNINLKFLNEKSLNRLFQIFYHFFTKFMQVSENTEDIGSRLFLNSIKGLNRMFSFMKGGNKETRANIEQKIQAIYKVVHTTPNIKAKIQLLLFLFQSHSYLHNGLSDRFYRTLYDFLMNDQILHCSLTEVFFDLLLVSLRSDENANRVFALIKRVLQLCYTSSTAFLITCLMMVDKVIQSNQALKAILKQKQNIMQEEGEEQADTYDMFKRQPKYANAQKTCLWEVRLFTNHYHPSVRKYAKAIIENNGIEYSGNNPLLQFSLTSFIQKFSLKRQKKSQAWKMKVRRNLSKIRSTKYESLFDKPLNNFAEDEDFIKKYLQKRSSIHNNFKKMQKIKDIEDFADKIIENEMDRLNPKEDDLDEDISLTPENSQEDQMIDEQGEDMGEQDEEIEGLDEENSQQDLDGLPQGMQSEDIDMEESDEESEDKEFEDAFQEMQESDSFPQKKNKKINKPFKKNNNKNNKNFKKGKKQFKKRK